jgi:hypothetical protein
VRIVQVQVVDVDVIGGQASRLSSHACSTQRRDNPPSCGLPVTGLPTFVARIQRRRFALIAAPTIFSEAQLA